MKEIAPDSPIRLSAHSPTLAHDLHQIKCCVPGKFAVAG